MTTNSKNGQHLSEQLMRMTENKEKKKREKIVGDVSEREAKN